MCPLARAYRAGQGALKTVGGSQPGFAGAGAPVQAPAVVLVDLALVAGEVAQFAVDHHLGALAADLGDRAAAGAGGRGGGAFEADFEGGAGGGVDRDGGAGLGQVVGTAGHHDEDQDALEVRVLVHVDEDVLAGGRAHAVVAVQADERGACVVPAEAAEVEVDAAVRVESRGFGTPRCEQSAPGAASAAAGGRRVPAQVDTQGARERAVLGQRHLVGRRGHADTAERRLAAARPVDAGHSRPLNLLMSNQYCASRGGGGGGRGEVRGGWGCGGGGLGGGEWSAEMCLGGG